MDEWNPPQHCDELPEIDEALIGFLSWTLATLDEELVTAELQGRALQEWAVDQLHDIVGRILGNRRDTALTRTEQNAISSGFAFYFFKCATGTGFSSRRSSRTGNYSGTANKPTMQFL